ncbi:hypothetical protein [Rhodococcus sp. IEGM 1318]|uniref:hypothetical protein n=1 Tax=Rhodococcus sp. IEGM 1318 TaxID=3082226 RepID=UPI00295461CE|nr:hypothetical protein [Rhodococcus sp. IEGM 1318]MDV8009650.1 hypothetical protein [Rhodococcus sp. IEGM 1318]
MTVIEIVEFTTHPSTTAENLKRALDALDRELPDIGGFQSRELYRAAGTDNGWLLKYRWATLLEAQNSMSKVAHTDAFANLMALVENPETMKMSYGIPA